MRVRFTLFLVFVCQLVVQGQAHALPAFARRYNVPCATCHATVPRLNAFGQAFQANFFNWPKKVAPEPTRGRIGTPVSAIITSSQERAQGEASSTAYRALELYPSDSFSLGNGRRGGYFADLIVHDASGETRSGTLEQAYIGLPLTEKLGLVVGQTTALLFQYDPITSLTDSLPGALESGAGDFTFLEARPTLRLDWFSGRGQATASGDSVAIGLPFQGGLALNKGSRLGGSQGAYLQAFRRQGPQSFGVFGYTHGTDSRFGALATRSVGEKLHLLAAQSQGQDSGTWENKSTIEAEWDASVGLGLTGRWEWFGAESYPVVALTVSPGTKAPLRFTLESVQQKSNRTTALFARIQL